VTDADQAAAAAREIGYPVVLKAMVTGVVHKTEGGLVRVGLGSDLTARKPRPCSTARAAGGDVLASSQAMLRPVADLRAVVSIGLRSGHRGGQRRHARRAARDAAVRLAPVSEETARR
jgi:acyl-CoA synthetase (NDP forming)